MQTGPNRTLNLSGLITYLHLVEAFVCVLFVSTLRRASTPPLFFNSPFGLKEQLPWRQYSSGLVGRACSQSFSVILSNLSPSPFFASLLEKKNSLALQNHATSLKGFFLKKKVETSTCMPQLKHATCYKKDNEWHVFVVATPAAFNSEIHKQKWYS